MPLWMRHWSRQKKFYTDHPIVNWGIFIDRFDMLGRKAIEKERKAGEKKKTDGT